MELQGLSWVRSENVFSVKLDSKSHMYLILSPSPITRK